jgi:hypothetical protein
LKIYTYFKKKLQVTGLKDANAGLTTHIRTATVFLLGTEVAQWLRYCATNQKVAGSIPDGVMEFFIDINPSDRTMVLGSTQYFLGVNAAGP